MFRFSIRDVLWLTVVAALAVSWWHEHRIHKADLGRLTELEGRHAKLERTHAVFNRALENGGYGWYMGYKGGAGYIVISRPQDARSDKP